eukprot:4456317-Ditylum_brightwellii.AAC.1
MQNGYKANEKDDAVEELGSEIMMDWKRLYIHAFLFNIGNKKKKENKEEEEEVKTSPTDGRKNDILIYAEVDKEEEEEEAKARRDADINV